MEKTFKTIFVLAVIVYSILMVGLFLLLIKIVLVFTPEVHILGVTLS